MRLSGFCLQSRAALWTAAAALAVTVALAAPAPVAATTSVRRPSVPMFYVPGRYWGNLLRLPGRWEIHYDGRRIGFITISYGVTWNIYIASRLAGFLATHDGLRWNVYIGSRLVGFVVLRGERAFGFQIGGLIATGIGPAPALAAGAAVAIMALGLD